MGNSSSKNSVTIDTSTAVSVAQENIQNSSQSINSSAVAGQTFTFKCVGCTIQGSDIAIGQNMSTTNQVTGKLDATALASMNTALQSQLSTAVDEAAKAQAGFLATSSSQAEDTTNIKNSISAAISQKTQLNNYQSLVASVVDTQKLTVDLSQTNILNSHIKADQILISNVMAQALLTSIIDAANQTLSSTSTKAQIKQSSESTSSGADSLLASLASLYGIWGATAGGTSLLCCCCCCCLICLSIIMAMQSNGSSQQSAQG
jgi:uncharacterized membrane protein